jgi:lipopolysaccharide biosynthesis glycosyltransferase
VTHIVITADGNYLPYVSCLLGQVATHGRAADGVIVVVPSDADESAAAGILRTAERVGLPVEVRPTVEPDVVGGFAGMPGMLYRSSFTYARLYLGDTLPDIDKVLYLDVDLLIRDSIDELLTWELEHPVAAVQEDTRQAQRLFGDVTVPYFNSGVMLMSLDEWRASDVAGSGAALLEAHPEWIHQDQDILNTIYRDRFDRLPARFNVFNGRTVGAGGATAAIVHFVGSSKPWYASATTSFADEWRAAQRAADPSWESPSGTGRSSAMERRLAAGLYAARQSAVGIRLRRALPNGLKHRVNAVVFAASRRSTRVRRSLASGLSSR